MTDRVRSSSPLPWLAGLAVVPLVLLALVDADPLATFARNWAITPLAFFAAAFANATAIGGGFVFVPLFIFVYAFEPIAALQLSLGTQAFGMSSGALGWSRRFIDVRALALAVAFAGLGMLIGSFAWVPSPLEVKAVFGWVSVVIAAAVTLEIRFGSRADAEQMPSLGPLDLLGFGIASLLGGIVTAWVSLGIGEVVALYLVFRHRVRIEKAIGTGVAALALCSVLGFAIHATRSFAVFPWQSLAFTVPGVLLGGFSGARAGRWLEAKMLERGRKSPLKTIFAVVVLLDGIVMLIHVHLH